MALMGHWYSPCEYALPARSSHAARTGSTYCTVGIPQARHMLLRGPSVHAPHRLPRASSPHERCLGWSGEHECRRAVRRIAQRAAQRTAVAGSAPCCRTDRVRGAPRWRAASQPSSTRSSIRPACRCWWSRRMRGRLPQRIARMPYSQERSSSCRWSQSFSCLAPRSARAAIRIAVCSGIPSRGRLGSRFTLLPGNALLVTDPRRAPPLQWSSRAVAQYADPEGGGP